GRCENECPVDGARNAGDLYSTAGAERASAWAATDGRARRGCESDSHRSAPARTAWCIGMMRPEFLQVGAMVMIGAGQRLGAQPDNRLASVKALVFDVFGKVVDWRTSVGREVEGLAKRKGLKID